MNVKDIINRQTIKFLKQIESIVTKEVSERSALYYRQRITRSVNSININDNKPLLSLVCQPNHCIKCLSHIEKWRIKPKTKTQSKSLKEKSNRLIGRCLTCGYINKLEGSPKRTPKAKPNKTINKTQQLNKSWNKFAPNSAKNMNNKNNSFITPNKSYESKSPMSDNSAKQKLILKNLLSSNKKRKADQKTGLSDFLQNCSQE